MIFGLSVGKIIGSGSDGVSMSVPCLKTAPPLSLCHVERHGPRMATSSYFPVQGRNPGFYMKSSNL